MNSMRENEVTNQQINLVKVHVRNASALALDWACARITNPQWFEDGLMDGDPMYMLDMDDGDQYRPTQDAGQAQALIDEAIERMERVNGEWRAVTVDGFGFIGKTMLEAVCRAYVFKHLGPFIQVPEVFLSY